MINYEYKHMPQCDGMDWWYGFRQYMTYKEGSFPNNLDIDIVVHSSSIRCRPVVFGTLPFRPGV